MRPPTHVVACGLTWIHGLCGELLHFFHSSSVYSYQSFFSFQWRRYQSLSFPNSSTWRRKKVPQTANLSRGKLTTDDFEILVQLGRKHSSSSAMQTRCSILCLCSEPLLHSWSSNKMELSEHGPRKDFRSIITQAIIGKCWGERSQQNAAYCSCQCYYIICLGAGQKSEHNGQLHCPSLKAIENLSSAHICGKHRV